MFRGTASVKFRLLKNRAAIITAKGVCGDSTASITRRDEPTNTLDRGWLKEAFDRIHPSERYRAMSPEEFRTHSPIALDVGNYLETIKNSMDKPPGRSKELIGITRGTATGKTTTLEWTLREAHLQWPQALCLGVTFNHLSPADQDLQDKEYKISDWAMTYAVGMVARMAAAVFDQTIEEAYEALRKPSVADELHQRSGKWHAVETVASCVEYLLARTNKTEILLAVDEVMASEEALLAAFPVSQEQIDAWASVGQSNYDALKILRKVLLDGTIAARSALLVSSLKRIELTESGRSIRPLPVPSRLAPQDVLSEWWLKDCSQEGSFFDNPTLSLAELRATKPRRTIYRPADEASEQRLLLLAALSSSLPRGLEFMKRQLDEEMKAVSPEADGVKLIKMDKSTTVRILRYARTTFMMQRNRSPDSVPPHIVVAWLYRRPMPPGKVVDFIKSSLFTNSVEDDEPIFLESCVLSLQRHILRISDTMKETATCLQILIDELMDFSDRQRHHGEPVQEGTPLEVAFLRMLQVKLVAKVEGPGTAGRQVSIQELLYPGWDARVAGSDKAARNTVFRAVIRLPDNITSFDVTEVPITACLNNDPVAFFEELNSIDLSSCRFRVLRGAPGDCFDVGLLFIDTHTKKVCLWLGDMKAAMERAVVATLGDTLPAGWNNKQVAVAEARQKISAAIQRGDITDDVTATGQALLEGRVVLSYVSTKEGPGSFIAGDATRCDVTVVGRETTRQFLTEALFAYYAVYRSVAAPAAKEVKEAIQARGG